MGNFVPLTITPINSISPLFTSYRDALIALPTNEERMKTTWDSSFRGLSNSCLGATTIGFDAQPAN